jgi:hypothetical protein
MISTAVEGGSQMALFGTREKEEQLRRLRESRVGYGDYYMY